MRQSEFFTPYRASAKRKTVEIKYLKRMMKYRHEREQSEPAGDYIAPARRRTVEIIIEANDAVWVCNRGNLSPPVPT